MILDSKAQRFAMPLIIGAETALSETNLSMIACDAKGDPERVQTLAEMLRSRTVDGLIVIGEHQAVSPSLTTLAGVPTVYVRGETTSSLNSFSSRMTTTACGPSSSISSASAAGACCT